MLSAVSAYALLDEQLLVRKEGSRSGSSLIATSSESYMRLPLQAP